jgi:hypothetical protein
MNQCADPLNVHKKRIIKDIRKISQSLFLACKDKLDANTFLCRNCREKLSKDPTLLNKSDQSLASPEDVVSSASEVTEASSNEEDQNQSQIDSILKDLGVTPIKKRKYFLYNIIHFLK